jgi:hypothetical protein
MAVKYAGAITNEDTGAFDSANYSGVDSGNQEYATGSGASSGQITCPGTGTQTITSLAVHINSNITANHVKIALYDASRTTLLAYATLGGSGGLDNVWVESTTPTIVGGATLTGGTKYSIQLDTDVNVEWHSKAVTSGDANQVASAFSSFPPASISSGSYATLPAMRLGVEAGAAGATPINVPGLSDSVSVTDELGGRRNFRASFGDNLEN